MTAPPALPFPNVPVYLFYGNQASAVLRAQDAVVEALVPKELRDENLTRYSASGNQFGFDFGKALPELAGDMATLSFVEDATKIAIVVNPVELYRGGAKRPARKKKTCIDVTPAC